MMNLNYLAHGAPTACRMMLMECLTKKSLPCVGGGYPHPTPLPAQCFDVGCQPPPNIVQCVGGGYPLPQAPLPLTTPAECVGGGYPLPQAPPPPTAPPAKCVGGGYPLPQAPLPLTTPAECVGCGFSPPQAPPPPSQAPPPPQAHPPPPPPPTPPAKCVGGGYPPPQAPPLTQAPPPPAKGDVSFDTISSLCLVSSVREESNLDSKSIDVIIFLVDQQNINGSWSYSANILAKVNIDATDFQNKKPKEISDEIWLTVLIYQFLVTKEPSREKEWRLVAKKAKQWIENNVIDRDLLESVFKRSLELLH